MARTDTPSFRKALGAVALWLLVCAALGYRSHRAVPPYDQRDGYRESMQHCADYRLDPSRNGEWTSRAPGRLAMAACTDRVRSGYLRAEDAEQRQVAVATLARALLPSLLLLLLAAFAEELRRRLPRGPGRG
jgi:hypothetical protein